MCLRQIPLLLWDFSYLTVVLAVALPQGYSLSQLQLDLQTSSLSLSSFSVKLLKKVDWVIIFLVLLNSLSTPVPGQAFPLSFTLSLFFLPHPNFWFLYSSEFSDCSPNQLIFSAFWPLFYYLTSARRPSRKDGGLCITNEVLGLLWLAKNMYITHDSSLSFCAAECFVT